MAPVGAHANTLENVPGAIVLYVYHRTPSSLCVSSCTHGTRSTLLAGLRYPVFAASALGFWSFCRIIYTLGYGTGDPKKRLIGSELSGVTLFGTYRRKLRLYLDVELILHRQPCLAAPGRSRTTSTQRVCKR